jgi:DNA-binding response OmpR family regulator
VTALLTVLVVDDDHRARTALVRALDDCPGLRAVGLDLEQAARLADGRGALSDAVVVDVPRATPTALRVVTVLAAGAPVLVTSLSGAVAGPSRGAGAAAFVEKDGDSDALVARIASHVRASVAQNAGEHEHEHDGEAGS